MTDENVDTIDETEELIEVQVDGLLVPVLKKDWDEDPDKVTEEVRAARIAVQTGDDIEEAPDYDAIVAEVGDGS